MSDRLQAQKEEIERVLESIPLADLARRIHLKEDSLRKYAAGYQPASERVMGAIRDVARSTARSTARVMEHGVSGARRELRQAREERGLSVRELAKLTKISAAHLTSLEEGGAPISESVAQRLKAALPALDLDEVLGGSDHPRVIDRGGLTGTMGSRPSIEYPPGVKSRLIPRLSRAQAGIMSAWSDDIYEHEGVDAPYVTGKRAFALEIEGDSMYPRLSPGDLVYVDADKTPQMGDLVIARKKDGDVMCKIFHSRAGGKEVVLTSYNDKQYPEITLPVTDFSWIYPIVGYHVRTRRD